MERPLMADFVAKVENRTTRVQSRLKDIGYVKEVLGGLVLTDDGLRRIATDR